METRQGAREEEEEEEERTTRHILTRWLPRLFQPLARADVICSKSSRSRPGSRRDEVCGQWSGQGCEARGWGTLRAPVAAVKEENTPAYTPHTSTARSKP